MVAKKIPDKKPTGKKPSSKKEPAKKTVNKKAVQKKSGSSQAIDNKATPAKRTIKKPVTKKETIKKALPKSSSTKNEVFRCSISGIPVRSETPNLSEKTLEKLKAILLSERERKVAIVEELSQEATDLMVDREAGDTQFDEESGEGDSLAVERERTLFLASEAQLTVERIDAALERMKNGTYGLCVPSSRRITLARLEALPWAEICVDCKMRSERRR